MITSNENTGPAQPDLIDRVALLRALRCMLRQAQTPGVYLAVEDCIDAVVQQPAAIAAPPPDADANTEGVIRGFGSALGAAAPQPPSDPREQELLDRAAIAVLPSIDFEPPRAAKIAEEYAAAWVAERRNRKGGAQ